MDLQAIAENAGYFMSDDRVYLKDNLTAFCTIEEAGAELGLKEITSTSGKVEIVDPDEDIYYDSWSDAAECGHYKILCEDRSGAWFIVDSDDDSYSGFTYCCVINNL